MARAWFGVGTRIDGHPCAGRGPARAGGPASRRPRPLAPGIAAVSLAALAGCATQPEPLTPAETALRVGNDLARLAEAAPPLDEPLTLHGAMARALLHNPDTRVRAMEQSLALRQTEIARMGLLLPSLTGRYGVDSRSNAQASSSRSVRTGRESLSASTSNDRTRRSGNLTAVWHVLDFGVSYYGAKQQSDRALVAHERRRSVVHTTIAEVRRAWWRAVAGARALARLEPLLARVRAALDDSARLADRQMLSPVDALRYQRALLETVDQLERQRRESRLAKIELAQLAGLVPGTEFELDVPASSPEPRTLEVTADELATLALSHRPELREGQLDERIAVHEVKKAMLRMLPGLELRAGAHVDSNSYLVNNDWLSVSAAVTANLTEVFTGPASVAAARAGRDLAAARREALSIAVLAQLYVALARFEEARARHMTAGRIADIEQRILEALRARNRIGAVGRLETTRGEIDVLRAQLAWDLRRGGRGQLRAHLRGRGRRHPAGGIGEPDPVGCRCRDRRQRRRLAPRRDSHAALARDRGAGRRIGAGRISRSAEPCGPAPPPRRTVPRSSSPSPPPPRAGFCPGRMRSSRHRPHCRSRCAG